MVRSELCEDRSAWDEFVSSQEGYPLQLWGWGEVKSRHGWRAVRIMVYRNQTVIGGAQVLIKSLPWPFRAFAYIPRGPVVSDPEYNQRVLDELTAYVNTTFHPVALSIEPSWQHMSPLKGWRQSPIHVLIPRTLILDLSKGEEGLMAHIAKKRRQDIRRSSAAVHDIHEVTSDEELHKVMKLHEMTAERAGFALHSSDYYNDVFTCLGKNSRLMAAWNDKGEPIAFCWLAVTPYTAFQLYSGASREGQQIRANYALKWWCITTMIHEGVAHYDLNGLLNDGISTFKKSFADHENQLVGTLDKPLSPWYPVWAYGFTAFKQVLRTTKKMLGRR